jgi:hypothetical protein
VNARLRNADGMIRMVVDPKCKETLKDLEQVHLKQKTSGGIEIEKATKGPKADRTHLCFDGDTEVETPDGVVRMRDLPKRGAVRGPFGEFVSYEDAGLTIPDAEMVDLCINGVGVIRCTPWHQMLTMEKGWVRADQAEGLTIASSSTLMDLRNSSGRSTGRTAGTLREETRGCTGSCTPTSSERSPEVDSGTFITRTGTERTTRLRTSNCSHAEATCPTMAGAPMTDFVSPEGRDFIESAISRLSGIDLRKGDDGTRSTARGRTGVSSRASASSAARASTTFWSERGCARRTARPRIATAPRSTTRTDLARDAGARSGPTSTPSRGSARGRVLRVDPAERADAYCLRVPEWGCFSLASGLVVSNSDGLGYYIAEVFPTRSRSAARDADFGR